MAQHIVVVLIVGCCFVYALWTLAPKAPRSRLATVLLKLPLPSLLQNPLMAAARQQGACGCDGCDRSVYAKAKPGLGVAGAVDASALKPITFARGNYTKKTPR